MAVAAALVGGGRGALRGDHLAVGAELRGGGAVAAADAHSPPAQHRGGGHGRRHRVGRRQRAKRSRRPGCLLRCDVPGARHHPGGRA
eukprot:3043002-Pyramimonas_sp.AAC.1